MTNRRLRGAALFVAATCSLALIARASARPQQQQELEPFRGVTTNGTVLTGLFPVHASGVSTQPMRAATDAFIASLTPEQRARTLFPANHDEWRLWNNVHRYTRAGTGFEEMTEAQRTRAFDMIRASLSAPGFEKARNVMRLNGHLAELLPERAAEYGEYKYWLTIMGTPSPTEPWGWQLDGHHLIINYFVLGDQVVMTPTFMGSEPVTATSGRFAGATVMKPEQDKGLAFMRSLDQAQRTEATIEVAKTRNNSLAQAFRDNLVLDYAGLRTNRLNATQREALLTVLAEYVNNMPAGHARVRMSEVREHLDDTYFAWIGDTGDDAVFYYRIQSPVILIEFDHQTPVALQGPRVPNRAHVHSVVRTPNGNDYGKDLLRQHYERHRDDPNHRH
jgi:predicted nuclease of restriction endonuclease-like (RecB) superfamily